MRTPRLPEFTMPEIRLPEMPEIRLPEMPEIRLPEMPDLDGLDEKVTGLMKDAAYITIGAGVLAIQSTQVRRRDLTRAVGSSLDTAREQVGEFVTTVEKQVGEFVGNAREQVGEIVTTVEKQVRALVPSR